MSAEVNHDAPAPSGAAHPLYLITGANRGFGYAIARAILQHHLAQLDHRVSLILTTRQPLATSTVLSELKQEMDDTSYGRVRIEVVQEVDWSSMEDLEMNLGRLCDHMDRLVASEEMFRGVTHTVLVNNAGTLGDVSRRAWEQCTHSGDVDRIRQFFDVNITSCFALTGRFLQWTSAHAEMASTQLHATVVNISSLLAVQPFPYWSTYATAKAARDMLMRVAALEWVPRVTVRTLSYAPGPLQNAMQDEVLRTLGDAEQRAQYQQLKERNAQVPEAESAQALVRLLTTGEDAWENGAHVDYYDTLKE